MRPGHASSVGASSVGASSAGASSGAERAARAIVDLINARPSSPRPDEIAEIIDRLAVSAAAPAPCPHCTDLDREYGPIIPQT